MLPRQDFSRRFTAADYAVFAVMLAVSAAIGLFYACTGNKQSTTKEFLFGGKSMRVIPVAISVLATFLSAITLLGVPAEAYQFGIQYWMINISYCFMIPVTAFLYVPVFYKMQVCSINEYLEKRFNRLVRTVVFAVSTIASLIYMAFVVYAPSLVLSQVTGINLWVCVLSIGIVCTFYTSIGGIKAVVWTDVFQTLIIFGAMLTIVIKGAMSAGGILEVWSKAEASKRTEMINIDPDPTIRHSFWTLTFGGFFTWLCIYAVNQAMIQRSLTIPTMKGATAVIWLNLPGNILIVTITCLAGLIIYANYSTCDPITTKQVSTPNQVLPLFVMETLGFLPGLPGLFVAGIFSGALSTLSSSLNSLSAVTLEDVVRLYVAPQMTDKWATRTAKILALGYGVVAIVLVAIVQNLTGTVLQAALSISGTLGGPILGIFSLGMFFPWPNAFGAMAGFVSGLAVCLWICVGAILNKRPLVTAALSVDSCPDYLNVTSTYANSSYATQSSLYNESDGVFVLYRLSYLWYSAIGCLVVIIVGLLCSVIKGKTKKDTIDPILMCPLFYRMWGCGKQHEIKIEGNSNGELKGEIPKVECGCQTKNGSIKLFALGKMDTVYPMHDIGGVYKKKSFDP